MTAHDEAVQRDLRALRVRADAHALLRVEQREREAAQLRAPESRLDLADELEIPEQPTRWRIADLLPMDTNLTVAVQFKTGKTTLMLNLMRSLVDGEPFLGEFDVHRVDGRVGYWNFELNEDMWRRWARDVDIHKLDRASVLPLAGYHIDLRTEVGADYAAEWLRGRDTEVWFLDPFHSAFDGDENSNSEVRDWLRAVEQIASRSGVQQIVMPVHTGRAKADEGAERARGATRLDDWTDVRWTYTTDNGARFLAASGRDVDFNVGALAYDPGSRRLVYGTGKSRAETRRDGLAERALTVIVGAGPGGISTTDVKTAIGVGRDTPLDRILRDRGDVIESLPLVPRGMKWRALAHVGQPWKETK